MNLMIFFAVVYCLQTTIGNDIFKWPGTHQVKKRKHFIYKGEFDGCRFEEHLNQSTICSGINCKNYPSIYRITKNKLKIKMTGIASIKKNDFLNLENITALIIEYNLDLTYLEPGCFQAMKKLTQLKMTLNSKLRSLDEDLFLGLDNLTHLSLRKNGFVSISDISLSLKPNIVPNLILLDLSENFFGSILQNDFKNMRNSNLTTLQLNLCGLEFIAVESLVDFKHLEALGIGDNHFNLTNLENAISNLVKYHIPLLSLNLQDSGYRQAIPYGLMQTISRTNISKLSLAENQFQQIKNTSFPPMPSLKSLDLSDNLIITIEKHSFECLSNLEELNLAGNKLTKIFSSILLPHLKTLDLSRISNTPNAVSYFSIADNIFENMTSLEDLRLSYNLIQTINKDTFKGLKNLKYLEMKNSTIFNIHDQTFLNTPQLTYLNIENNPLHLQTVTLNYNNFAGLTNLKFFLFGGCNITDLSSKPSPFYYLNNLEYLGLHNNLIYKLSSHIFEPLVKLKTLDLSNNKLIPWKERLFSNNSIKELDISQNKFKRFTKAMLDDFKKIENINLDNNPFICDCNLLQIDSFNELLSNATYKNILLTICSNLEFQGKFIRDFIFYLKTNSQYCNPGSTNKILYITIASVFLIIIGVLLLVLFIYRHYIKYFLFLIKITVRRHSKWWKNNRGKHGADFKYDAFVSYSCTDNQFVNKLVSRLENNDPYLKLCVYERDFKIGSIISEEIMNNILQSKRTLLILSDEFAKSQWCRWETRLAEHHQLFFQNDDSLSLDDTLVMVKLNDIPKKLATPTLKYLMKTRIYLEWNENNENEFWEKLRNTLAAPKGNPV